MLEDKKIMVILAHPDDETLGCGGTLHKFSKNKICLLYPIKRIEAQFEQAIKHLGVSNFLFGNFDDNSLDKYPLLDVCKFVENGLEKFNPDVVITHHYNCANQDHRALYEACSIATRPVRRKICLLTCEVPSSTGYLRPCGFEPNYYVELDAENLQAKALALNEYVSEARPDRSVSVINALAKLRGAESGTNYSEGFMLVRGYG